MQVGGGRGGRKGDLGYKKELRRPEEVAESEGLKAYRKKEGEENYYTGAGGGRKSDSGEGKGRATAATPPPGGKQVSTNTTTTTTTAAGQQKQPKAQGTLISDLLAPKVSKPTAKSNTTTTTTTPSGSNNNSNNNSNKSKYNSNKIHIPATSSNLRAPQPNILSDLEAALRALEVTTNPTLTNTQKRTICNCQATRHDLLLAAPNCLSCGKIICIREGPGPCTFCGAPLLSSSETQDMISFLKEERGREKMAMDKRAHKKAEVARTPKAYSQPSGGALPPQLGLGYGTPTGQGGEDEDAAALKRAKEHRDKLLTFQATNAQRTKIIDEAADFDTGAIASVGYSGLNMWATPEERALQLKKQQRRMREVQWAAKESWEKRRVVVSIDISGKGGKGKGAVVTRREMKEVEMDEVSEGEEGGGLVDLRALGGSGGVGEGEGQAGDGKGVSGSYARNPLLKGLVRPVFTPALNNSTPTYTKGKEKSKAPQVKDDYIYTQQEDDPEFDYDGLPEVVKKRMRDVRMGTALGGTGGGGWKRVLQDEQDVKDNEKWILDGGRGGGGVEVSVGEYWEEPGCG
ncbi:hypothetical protein L211DRAFT_97047 [Terfezia boudieri ATCC MYA-4762]|uniref:TRIP4/RQT4 C2HC5-type zinc finger domain-containing protein n=1 Tax=Terfezia boudieri ATCC MYA-4762 TaxID=1051890 RepID=A0A3N4LYD5_9PEZI|nr:hypothetical protein L211DRAFT_97047 [Terfezia boudieri ATCC MYA-4762]